MPVTTNFRCRSRPSKPLMSNPLGSFLVWGYRQLAGGGRRIGKHQI
jgi:hypothetical protein